MTASTEFVNIRNILEADAAEALQLMRNLAEFEGYAQDFSVTLRDILQYGFGPGRRFTCLVAEGKDQEHLLGMAVLFEEPWNYQMQPTLVLKELFVRPEARSHGVGSALFQAAKDYCQSIGGVRLRWLVLNDNASAQAMYRRHGGSASRDWQVWEVAL